MKKQKSKLAKFDKRNVNNSFPILSSLLTKEYRVSFTDENATGSVAQSKSIHDLPKRLEESVKTDTLIKNSVLPELFRLSKKEELIENCVHSVPEMYSVSDYLNVGKDTARFNEVTEDQNENDVNSKDEEPANTNPEIPGMESDNPKTLLTEEPGELYSCFFIFIFMFFNIILIEPN